MSRPSNPGDGLSPFGLPATPGSIYELAVTHRSFAFEQAVVPPHNERLEFLGDAILGAVVTELIYDRYPELAEGDMARLRASTVSTPALAELALELGVGDHLRLGRGEEVSGGRTKASLLADAFEALVGAVFVDLGIDRVTAILAPLFITRLENAIAAGGGHDAKGALQEAVARRLGTRPTYRVSSSGPEHSKSFIAQVFIDDELFGAGSGSSKKEAELNAAREALAQMTASDIGKSHSARAS
ncbi:MAG: ribonuclease III [Actinobacteria bacterium]|nr:ribonuclease III [Actinomycetota bacterium]